MGWEERGRRGVDVVVVVVVCYWLSFSRRMRRLEAPNTAEDLSVHPCDGDGDGDWVPRCPCARDGRGFGWVPRRPDSCCSTKRACSDSGTDYIR